MAWQPFETAPKNVHFDLWVKSKNNPDFGRRACNIIFADGALFGEKLPEPEYGEYPAYWMPVPDRPFDIKKFYDEKAEHGNQRFLDGLLFAIRICDDLIFAVDNGGNIYRRPANAEICKAELLKAWRSAGGLVVQEQKDLGAD